ncbi:MAG: DUF2914 domain-containing protein [Persicimonas sp.]
MNQQIRQKLADFDERFGVAERTEKLRRWFPFMFFVGGFLFDVLTLGRMVTTTDLIVVAGYAVGVAVCLVVRSRPLSETVHRRLGFALHFCLGSLFSALVVVYFKSAGEWYTVLTVLALFGAMVWNEFAEWGESQLHLLWAIYGVSLVMLFNFIVPHLTKSISAWWFYLSSALGIALIYGLAALAKQPPRTLRAATAAAAAVVVLYLLGWVPPVPLVMKSSVVGTSFEKQDGEYTCEVDEQHWLVDAGIAEPTIQWRQGEAVAALTAIFAPDAVEAPMEHRWFREVDGEWSQTDTIPFKMRGGRKNGWRMWSTKRHLAPGRWRVATALDDGVVLGYQTFWIQESSNDDELDRRRQAL